MSDEIYTGLLNRVRELEAERDRLRAAADALTVLVNGGRKLQARCDKAASMLETLMDYNPNLHGLGEILKVLSDG